MGFVDALLGAAESVDRALTPKPSGPTWGKTVDMHEIADRYERSGDAESAASWRVTANKNYLAMLKEGER